MEDYIVILDKPKGITSFSFIQKYRKENNIKKIGHAGTLDPLAQGLMIVMVNSATKFSDLLMKHDKTYLVELELGYQTDTLDLEGEITSRYEGDIHIDENLIKEAILSFKGEIMQVPPMYSAIKMDGKKLYDIARKGITLDIPARKVNIYDIRDIKIEENRISFISDVSSGTYIRSLVRDIGQKLGYFATMTKLVRTKIDKFSFDDINKPIYIEDILDYDKIEVDKETYDKLKNGMTRIIPLNNVKTGKLKVYYENNFVGVVEIIKNMGYNYYIKRTNYFN